MLCFNDKKNVLIAKWLFFRAEHLCHLVLLLKCFGLLESSRRSCGTDEPLCATKGIGDNWRGFGGLAWFG